MSFIESLSYGNFLPKLVLKFLLDVTEMLRLKHMKCSSFLIFIDFVPRSSLNPSTKLMNRSLLSQGIVIVQNFIPKINSPPENFPLKSFSNKSLKPPSLKVAWK